jgi:hypothetical protein
VFAGRQIRIKRTALPATADIIVSEEREKCEVCHTLAMDGSKRGSTPHHLKAMLSPYPSEEMVCWPVSRWVGNVNSNDLSLMEPIAAQ